MKNFLWDFSKRKSHKYFDLVSIPLVVSSGNGDILFFNTLFLESFPICNSNEEDMNLSLIIPNFEDFKNWFCGEISKPFSFHIRILENWKYFEIFAVAFEENFVLSFVDKTKEKKYSIELESANSVDILTSLPNRIRMKSVMEKQIRECGDASFPVLFADLDHFKKINDSSGHTIGDRFLLAISDKFYNVAQKNKTMISRFGGDEFVFLMPMGSSDLDAERLCLEILEVASESIEIDDKELLSGVSIGVSIYPNDGRDVDSLLKNSDTALHVSKQSGRSTFRFFDWKMSEENDRYLQVEHLLRQDLLKGGKNFEVHLQPQFSLKTGFLVGAEALVRFYSESENRWISPGEFIPVAEKSGSILEVGHIVLERSLQCVQEWKSLGHAVPISINVSVRQIEDSSFWEKLRLMVLESEDTYGLIRLEITESMMAEDAEKAIRILEEMCEIGYELSLDDFGTGYSSLSYLRKMPFNELKIDRSFVIDIPAKEDACHLASAVLMLAEALHLKTVFEGVETEDQLAWIQQNGCNKVQGFVLGKPMPIPKFNEEFLKYIENAHPKMKKLLS